MDPVNFNSNSTNLRPSKEMGVPWNFYFTASLIFIAFLIFHYFMGGLHRVHFYYVAFGALLVFFHEKTRLFVILALPVFLHNISYDIFRYVPFDWYLPIHIEDIYQWDLKLFGISQKGGVLLFHEYVQLYAQPVFDILCGLFYHIHSLMIFVLVFILWQFKSKQLAFLFSITFLLMNVFSFATYLWFPAAAPWYVEAFGFVQPSGPVVGSAAGMAKMDQLLSLNISENMYSLNPIVFGAVPSMHAGFTFLSWLFARKINIYWNLGFGIYTGFMCFSALYLGHHYLLDVVLGLIYALAAYGVMVKWQAARVDKIYLKIEQFCFSNSSTEPELVQEAKT